MKSSSSNDEPTQYDVDDVDSIQQLADVLYRLSITDQLYIKVNSYCLACGCQSIEDIFCSPFCEYQYYSFSIFRHEQY